MPPLLSYLPTLAIPVALFLAFFLGAFLYFREGRHELIDSQFLFDTLIVGLVGAFLAGRFLDFLIRPEIYQWSVKRLVFFNAYGGIDFRAALLGLVIFWAIYLKNKKVGFWQIFDLASPALVFAQAVASLGYYFSGAGLGKVALYYFLSFLVIFWILKRLMKKKRQAGFFACFYLTFLGIVELALYLPKGQTVKIANLVPYELLWGLFLLIFGVVFWHILAKRRLAEDAKTLIGIWFLSLLRVRRMLTSIEEAGLFSKSVLFSPLYLVRSAYYILRALTREIALSFTELVDAFRTKR